MPQPFLAEIRPFAFGLVPKGWLPCEGQLLPIAENQALFSIIGEAFGGDGAETFALPDLRGRVPMHPGSGVGLAKSGGATQHKLSLKELPEHSHPISGDASKSAVSNQPINRLWGKSSLQKPFAAAPSGALHQSAISQVGGDEPHDNVQPYLTLNFCIAVNGIFPTRG